MPLFAGLVTILILAALVIVQNSQAYSVYPSYNIIDDNNMIVAKFAKAFL